MRPPFLFFEDVPLLNVGLCLQNSAPVKFTSAFSMYLLLSSLAASVHASPPLRVSSLHVAASPTLGLIVAFFLTAFSDHHNLQGSRERTGSKRLQRVLLECPSN